MNHGENAERNTPFHQVEMDEQETISPNAIRSIIYETINLFHRLISVHEQMHGLSSGKRGILMNVCEFGPLTVPQLTRQRPVSRQYIQKVVNQLHNDGLLEFVDNPLHKRSCLVRVTKSGRELLYKVIQREAQLFDQINLPAENEDLENTAHILRILRQFFESKAWQKVVDRPTSPDVQCIDQEEWKE